MLTGRCDRGDRVPDIVPPHPTLPGVPDFADEETTELERKARALSWVALTETVTYLVLFYFWIVNPNVAGKAITGSIHGMVWLSFVAMVVMITSDMGWSWRYSVAVIVLGPIGGIMVWERIRREGVPEHRRTRPV
jgi:Domain of unknown function (DUF3817)